MIKNSDIEKVLIIFNPASTNSKRLNRRINELRKCFPASTSIEIIETSPKGRVANHKLLVSKKHLLGPGTLLCIAAGDGTVNLVIETLVNDPNLTATMRKTPILPLWGGNANDLAHMLNGYYSLARMKGLLRKGTIIRVYPLKITLQHESNNETRIAACYVSFGATAFAANRINTPKHRNKSLTNYTVLRLLPEADTIVKAFVDAPRFSLKENGKSKTLFEYAIINGSRIAKLERMPIRLTDNAFYVAKISRKHPVIILYLLQVLRRRRIGRVTSTNRQFQLIDPVWMQFDGEVKKLHQHTIVKVEICQTPFYALSKRLTDNK